MSFMPFQPVWMNQELLDWLHSMRGNVRLNTVINAIIRRTMDASPDGSWLRQIIQEYKLEST
jgi:hypothetical protein